MLLTQGLRFRYPSGAGFAFPDMGVRTGEVMLVLGPSGSGKTTLLHLIAGLMPSSSGEIIVAGTPIASLSGSRLDAFRGRSIGLVAQRPQFIRSVSLMHNLQLARTLPGLPPDEPRALQLLTELGMADKAHRMTDALSIGERQRAAIARALMPAPGLLLADEPTSALDDLSCQRVAGMLRQAAHDHQAGLVIVTHDHRLKEIFPHQVTL